MINSLRRQFILVSERMRVARVRSRGINLNENEATVPTETPARATDDLEQMEIINGLRKSGLFDSEFYINTYPDVGETTTDPIEHYVLSGAAEGRNPSSIFSTRFYELAYPDVVQSGINPLLHYHKFGRLENRSPWPSAAAGNFIFSSASCHIVNQKQWQQYLQLRNSGLFDELYYLARYEDMQAPGVDPLAHYILAGADEGRNPSPHFNTLYYCTINPDVQASNLNPLYHYLSIGRAESRATVPKGDSNGSRRTDAAVLVNARKGVYCDLEDSGLFNAAYYLESYKDIRGAGIDPLAHFIILGADEGRNPSPQFNTNHYKIAHPDVNASGINPLWHFLKFGMSEKRNIRPVGASLDGNGSQDYKLVTSIATSSDYREIEASGLFDSQYYTSENRDVAATGIDPLTHYLIIGAAEGRNPSTKFNTLYYRSKYPDVDLAGINPLLHYWRVGRDDKRTTLPSPGWTREDAFSLHHLDSQQKKIYAAIKASGLFDAEYYGERYPDVRAADIDPLTHYILHGAHEERWPNRDFNPLAYIAINRNVYFSDINPLLHYIETRGTHELKEDGSDDPRTRVANAERGSASELLAKAKAQVWSADWIDAALTWERLIAVQPDNVEAHRGLIECYLRLRRPTAAMQALVNSKICLTSLEYEELRSLECQVFSASPTLGLAGGDVLMSSPLTMVHKQRLRERLKQTPLFDPAFYTQGRPDGPSRVRDALDHYVKWGSRARLRTCSRMTVARVIGWLDQDYEDEAQKFRQSFEQAQEAVASLDQFLSDTKIGVFLHTQSNFYMRPIAESLCEALRAAGARAEIMSELERNPESVTIPIVMAPHEFFGFRLPSYFQSEIFAKLYIAFNTEQLPSDWFKDCFSDLLSARAIIDVNFHSACILGRALPTLHSLPAMRVDGWNEYTSNADPAHEQLRWLSPNIRSQLGIRPEFDDRPLDVFFAGFSTPHRDATLTRLAPYLAGKQSYLAYGSKNSAAAQPPEKNASIFANNLCVCGLSKIVLNVHRFSLGYFEWERMIAQGFMAQACVVSTPSLRSPFFTPGVHYLEVPARHIDPAVQWLLETDEGRAAARQYAVAASGIMRHDLTPARVGHHLISFLASLPEPY
jgi:hypothetical protein